MSSTKRSTCLVFIGAFILLLTASQAYSLIIANRGWEFFEQSDAERAVNNGENYIVEAASCFLVSYSDYLQVLNIVELSGGQVSNSEKAELLLRKSVKNLELALLAYERLSRLAAVTGYNPDKIQALEAFDYKGFCERKGLDPKTFAGVAVVLSKGDLEEFFIQLKTKSQVIIDNLNQVLKLARTNQVDANLASRFLRINQLYSDTMFYGQHAAEVFSSVL